MSTIDRSNNSYSTELRPWISRSAKIHSLPSFAIKFSTLVKTVYSSLTGWEVETWEGFAFHSTAPSITQCVQDILMWTWNCSEETKSVTVPQCIKGCKETPDLTGKRKSWVGMGHIIHHIFNTVIPNIKVVVHIWFHEYLLSLISKQAKTHCVRAHRSRWRVIPLQFPDIFSLSSPNLFCCQSHRSVRGNEVLLGLGHAAILHKRTPRIPTTNALAFFWLFHNMLIRNLMHPSLRLTGWVDSLKSTWVKSWLKSHRFWLAM